MDRALPTAPVLALVFGIMFLAAVRRRRKDLWRETPAGAPAPTLQVSFWAAFSPPASSVVQDV